MFIIRHKKRSAIKLRPLQDSVLVLSSHSPIRRQLGCGWSTWFHCSTVSCTLGVTGGTFSKFQAWLVVDRCCFRSSSICLAGKNAREQVACDTLLFPEASLVSLSNSIESTEVCCERRLVDEQVSCGTTRLFRVCVASPRVVEIY